MCSSCSTSVRRPIVTTGGCSRRHRLRDRALRDGAGERALQLERLAVRHEAEIQQVRAARHARSVATRVSGSDQSARKSARTAATPSPSALTSSTTSASRRETFHSAKPQHSASNRASSRSVPSTPSPRAYDKADAARRRLCLAERLVTEPFPDGVPIFEVARRERARDRQRDGSDSRRQCARHRKSRARCSKRERVPLAEHPAVTLEVLCGVDCIPASSECSGGRMTFAPAVTAGRGAHRHRRPRRGARR